LEVVKCSLSKGEYSMSRKLLPLGTLGGSLAVFAFAAPAVASTIDYSITGTLSGTGLGALGLFGWRRKRRALGVA